jgi:hypothetical protein
LGIFKNNDMPGNLAICWDSQQCKRLPISNLTSVGQSAGDYYKNKILRDCALNIFMTIIWVAQMIY